MPVATMPLVAPGLAQVALGGEVVVFDPSTPAAHRLNPTAALVLGRCDGATPVADVCGALSEHFGVAPARLADEVAAVLADFRRQGLVTDGRPHAVGAALVAPGAATAETATPLPVVARVHTLGPLHALDVDATVTTDDDAIHRAVTALLGSLGSTPAPPGRAPVPETIYELVPATHGIDVRCEGHLIGNARNADAALALLQWHLNSLVAGRSARRLLLHAAAATAPDGRVAVFPGEANSGKSTLVAGLTQAGFGYLTDETVAVDPGGSRVEGYRKPVNLDPGSWSLFPEVVPADAAGRGREHLVDPCALRPDALADPADGPVGLLAFPTYQEASVTRAAPLSSAAALVSLVGHCTNLTDQGQRGLETLAALCGSAPAFELTVGDLDEAVAVVAELVALPRG